MHNFAWSWLKHGVHSEVDPFFENQDLGQKIRLLLQDPGFHHWPVCSPRRDDRFGSTVQLFASKKRPFREEKKRLTRQKVFSHPTVSASNSPSALSVQALWAKRAGWIQESLSQDSMTVTTIIKQTTYSPPRILVMTSSEGSPKIEWPSTSEAESAVQISNNDNQCYSSRFVLLSQ